MAEARRKAEERLRAKARGAPQSREFARMRSRAREYVADPQRLVTLVEDAARKSQQRPSGRLGESLEDLKTLLRMTLATARSDYQGLPRDKLVMIVAAIAYFLSPIDVIPDFLGPFGLTDDAVVLGFVMRALREEVRRFEAWEVEHGAFPMAEVIDITREPS